MVYRKGRVFLLSQCFCSWFLSRPVLCDVMGKVSTCYAILWGRSRRAMRCYGEGIDVLCDVMGKVSTFIPVVSYCGQVIMYAHKTQRRRFSIDFCVNVIIGSFSQKCRLLIHSWEVTTEALHGMQYNLKVRPAPFVATTSAGYSISFLMKPKLSHKRLLRYPVTFGCFVAAICLSLNISVLLLFAEPPATEMWAIRTNGSGKNASGELAQNIFKIQFLTTCSSVV